MAEARVYEGEQRITPTTCTRRLKGETLSEPTSSRMPASHRQPAHDGFENTSQPLRR